MPILSTPKVSTFQCVDSCPCCSFSTYWTVTYARTYQGFSFLVKWPNLFARLPRFVSLVLHILTVHLRVSTDDRKCIVLRPSQERRTAMRGSYNNRVTVVQRSCDAIEQLHDFCHCFIPPLIFGYSCDCHKTIVRCAYDVKHILHRSMFKISNDGFNMRVLLYDTEKLYDVWKVSMAQIKFSYFAGLFNPQQLTGIDIFRDYHTTPKLYLETPATCMENRTICKPQWKPNRCNCIGYVSQLIKFTGVCHI